MRAEEHHQQQLEFQGRALVDGYQALRDLGYKRDYEGYLQDCKVMIDLSKEEDNDRHSN